MLGIIHYNMGNITSVKNSLEFVGANAMILERPKEFDDVSHIILPGVGAFKEGMRNLRAGGFIEALQTHVLQKKKPFLGICLGMQLLATTGQEGGNEKGLNFVKSTVKRLPNKGLRIPHIGWNTVHVTKQNPLINTDCDCYFVHSYYVDVANTDNVIATTDYGIEFPVMLQSGNIFGAQFHPEKSHKAGLGILKKFSLLAA